jgi:hypothetical protein
MGQTEDALSRGDDVIAQIDCSSDLEVNLQNNSKIY